MVWFWLGGKSGDRFDETFETFKKSSFESKGPIQRIDFVSVPWMFWAPQLLDADFVFPVNRGLLRWALFRWMRPTHWRGHISHTFIHAQINGLPFSHHLKSQLHFLGKTRLRRSYDYERNASLTACRTGWPDWANFRLLGGCFLWSVWSKITKMAQILSHYFPVKVINKIWPKNGFGYVLGDVFKNAFGHSATRAQLNHVMCTISAQKKSKSFAKKNVFSWKMNVLSASDSIGLQKYTPCEARCMHARIFQSIKLIL
jgi:hypothetical protein